MNRHRQLCNHKVAVQISIDNQKLSIQHVQMFIYIYTRMHRSSISSISISTSISISISISSDIIYVYTYIYIYLCLYQFPQSPKWKHMPPGFHGLPGWTRVGFGAWHYWPQPLFSLEAGSMGELSSNSDVSSDINCSNKKSSMNGGFNGIVWNCDG